MKNYLFSRILTIGVIFLFVGVNASSCTNIRNDTNCSINIDSNEGIIKDYNNEDDGNLHAYFMVDFNITVHRHIFCSYLILDIQGKEYVPFFNAIKFGYSSSPVVDITIERINGQTLEFSLEDGVFILAIRLTDVETNLPKFKTENEGYIEGHASFIIFF
jgi:hypothetical protein